MSEITISKEKFERIIRASFRKGESWGVTYSTWFTPKEHEHVKRMKAAVEKGYEMALGINDK